MKTPRMTRATMSVLRLLLKLPMEGSYGLEICRMVEYPAGTVYPILYRFTELGWLVSCPKDIDPQRAGRPAWSWAHRRVLTCAALAGSLPAPWS